MGQEHEKVSRRGIIKAGIAGVIGLAVGAAGGYLARPPEIREVTRTLTREVTRTQVVTQTVGARSPPPPGKITIASASDRFSFQVVQQFQTFQVFKDMGYNTEYSLLGVRGSLSAFAAKQAPFWIGTNDEMAPLIEKGEKVILVGPGAILGYFLVARSDIKSLKDLEGRTIGISKPGAVSHNVPLFMLREAGVDPAKVKFSAVGGSGARSRALLAGRIDAGMIIADLAITTVQQSGGKLHLLASVSDVAPGRALDLQGIYVYRDYAERNPEIVKDYVRSRVLADVWASNNKAEFVRLSAEKIREKTDAETLKFYAEVYDLYRSRGWLPLTAVDTESVELQISMAKQVGSIKREIRLDEFYEPRYIQDVIKGLMKYSPSI